MARKAVKKNIEETNTTEVLAKTKDLSVESTSNVNETEKLSEVELLKKQMDELKALVAQQSALLQAQQSPTTSPTVILQNNQRYIKVTSMINGLLNLSTDRFGKGKFFKIEKLLDTVQILDSDLRNIIDSHRRLIDDGIIYILDENFIDEKGLRFNFEGKITPDELREFYTYADENRCFEIFKKATPFQRESMFNTFCVEYKSKNLPATLAEKIGKFMDKNIFEIIEKSYNYQQVYENEKNNNDENILIR